MSQYEAPKRGMFRLRGNALEVFGRTIGLPANRIARMALGIAFMIGGVFSFLPILGVWMLPVGLLILSIDLPFVRRWRRRTEVRWGRRSRPKAMTSDPGARQVQYKWMRWPSFGRR